MRCLDVGLAAAHLVDITDIAEGANANDALFPTLCEGNGEDQTIDFCTYTTAEHTMNNARNG